MTPRTPAKLLVPSSALLLAAGELQQAAAVMADDRKPNEAAMLMRIAKLLLTEHGTMSQFADAIHKVQQQLKDANAARDKAQADADKNAADAQTLADLRTGGFIADQSDVDAAKDVLNPTTDPTAVIDPNAT